MNGFDRDFPWSHHNRWLDPPSKGEAEIKLKQIWKTTLKGTCQGVCDGNAATMMYLIGPVGKDGGLDIFLCNQCDSEEMAWEIYKDEI